MPSRTTGQNGPTLVIVESPTKAKTISKFLGSDFIVKSSFGHIRDLPEKKIAVDIEHDFAPTYVIPDKAKPHVAELKQFAKNAKEIILATDEDREGEAIAWHLCAALGVKPEKTKRIAFHEITPEAIHEALQSPRTVDMKLVDAQQARRVLDRIVGYELSPFLWQKVLRGLSAGRVQSPAVRLIVEREKEIRAFDAKEYWTIHGLFNTEGSELSAELSRWHGKVPDKFEFPSTEIVEKTIADLRTRSWTIASVETKEVNRQPLPPFTTSTLQQAASSRLGFSPKQTMMLAQKLYEGIPMGKEGSVGLITYMRTDSVNLSERFIEETQQYVLKTLGQEYATGGRRYSGKSKNAQEAHEAIRPTGVWRAPSEIQAKLDPQQFKLYELIWNRAVASQLPPARIKQTGINIADKTEDAVFRASGSILVFPGWLAVYDDEREERRLPEVQQGAKADAKDITGTQHFTEPPPRYSEATLIKALEELGIGRPSTYAPTIATIMDRGYVEKQQDKKLHPLPVAETVTQVLVDNFPHVADYSFTANLEDELDQIARGETEWVPVIRAFYIPFKKNLEEKYKTVDKKQLTEELTDTPCPNCGKPMLLKLGRFGKFLACSGYPECKTTQPYGEEAVRAAQEREIGIDKATGLPIVAKVGRYGPYVQLGQKEEGSKTKPKMAGLLAGMKLEELSLEDASALLSLPRTLGSKDGEDVIASNGKFGPYVKHGAETRSIPRTDARKVLVITLEEALDLLSKPKVFRGRGRKKS